MNLSYCESRRRLRISLFIALATVAVHVVGPVTAARAENETKTARALLLAGKYEEAAEAYAALADSQPIEAAIGLARCRAAVGKRDEVAKLLADATAKRPQSAALQAEAARWALARGDLAAAGKAAEAALALDRDQLQARWVQAERLRMTGDLEAANAAYKWFVDYYNTHDVTDPESLGWIGLGAAQYARWNRLSGQFSFLVNELYPDALKADPAWWPAHYAAGVLYLEKYNQPEAARELKAALALNPHAAEVHAALARQAAQNFDVGAARAALTRALELDPTVEEALLVRGDILLSNFQATEAVPVFEEAVRLHPASEAAAGRLAAAYAVVDGFGDADQEARLAHLIHRVEVTNPHCGEFYASFGMGLDQSRRYPDAAKYLREAITKMPQLVGAYGDLGVVLMRLGEEIEAKQQLDAAFAADPFNVRVNNMLKVLEVLEGYAVLETEHFILRFDRGRDEILARYAARYLEDEVYPELCRTFQFEPTEKSQFEIFNRARNTNGHGWFSARMIGLPFVHTVGACAGKIVALASPNDMPTKYNWARVLKHEFVHVLNLEQTHFAIPHWFTEALAVRNEGFARPPSWNELLKERVPKNELFNLDTINLGFVRPQSGLDWQMAYCQADLYARYMTEKYGDDALAKMLKAYRDNLDTPAALARELGVQQADFEKGYVEYVRDVVARLGAHTVEPDEPAATLERLHRAQPDDARVAARLAASRLARKDYAEARKLAEAVLKNTKANAQARQQAAYVLARVRLVVGETQTAVALLEEHLNREEPDDHLLNLLAGLRLKAEQYAAAEELYRIGAARHPAADSWQRSLARLYLAQADDVKLAEVLEKLAALDADDVPIRKKRAQLALAADDYAAATRWGREALHIDVMDVDVHRLLGKAAVGSGDFRTAADEFEVAVQLDGKDVASQIALAEACLRADRRDRARQALQRVRELAPGNPRAAALEKDLSQ
ncbi:MAG TPA: tetratricopeptide repeat protein [Pirellulales bacterium]|nr:tetratricopeptide repeat protein [Pirellulales bacterium]